MKQKKILIPIALVVALIILVGTVFAFKNKNSSPNDLSAATPIPTPKLKVNLIDVKDRPFVTLQPLSSRNELQFSIHNLPLKADNVEVLLEYDRNKGILDAVLKNFDLDTIPYINKLFMGSKSSGGATTYHDDVIGGTINLSFSGGDQGYALAVPWRYDDTQPHYTQLATADLKFQLILDQPFRTPKVIIMESPGLPAKLDGQVIAGPYLVRGVGPLPTISAKLTIHLADASTTAKLYGFDGQKWQQLDAVIDGRSLTASVPLLDTYVVIQ